LNDYLIFRNNLGQVDSVNRIFDGASLPFNYQNKTFDESDPLVIELRQWESQNGALDLGDIPPEPEPELIAYRINCLLPVDKNINLDRFPSDINYNTDLVVGLSTLTIDYFGLRVAQIYTLILDIETLEKLNEPTPIVFERYFYDWNKDTLLPNGRTKHIYFYQTNGELSTEFKVLPKEFYNTSDKEDITYRRRQTIVSWLIARSKELGLGNALEGFFAEFKDECDRYIYYGDQAIINLSINSKLPWLDADTGTAMGTVRNTLATCFNKAKEPTPNEEVDAFLRKGERAGLFF
jgi:hypothetical protein